MRVGLLGILVITGCYRSVTPAAPNEPLTVDERPPTALVEPPALVATSGAYVVAGCNTACTDCALNGGTYVIGTLDRTGAHLFPSPNPPGPPGNPYSCSASVAIGERITLRAHTTEAVRLGKWRAFFDSDYCPCAGTNVSICRVVVTPEIASQYNRVYCGADWVPKATAQIGR